MPEQSTADIVQNIQILLNKEPQKFKVLEKCAVIAALTRTHGNVTKAARILGLGRTTMYRKLRLHGLDHLASGPALSGSSR